MRKGSSRQRLLPPQHVDHQEGGRVENPGQRDGGGGDPHRRQSARPAHRRGLILCRLGTGLVSLNLRLRRRACSRNCPAVFSLFLCVLCDSLWPPSLRHKPPQKPIVQQQHRQHQHQVVQEGIVRGRDNDDLPRRHDKEARDSPAPGQERHPHQQQFHGQRGAGRRLVEPVRQVLHVPANPGGQRAVLVVIVHRGQVAPGRVAA